LVIEAMDGVGFSESQVEELLRLSFQSDAHSPFTRGLSGFYRRIAGEHKAEVWLRNNAFGLAPDNIGDLFQGWPDNSSTWSIVRKFGADVVASYWKRRSPRYVEGSRRTLLQAVLMYLRYGRAIEAIQSALNRFGEIPTRLILRMLIGTIQEINAHGQSVDSMTAYYVEKAFEELDKRPDATLEAVSDLELRFLPIVEHSDRPLRLHKQMATDPALYHQVLRAAFKADNEDREPTEAERVLGRRTYSLLKGFSEIPGYTEAGLDETVLAAWIDEVRRLGGETSRAAVTDNLVGRMLAHAPPDQDGGWPHRAVRNQIERIHSDELEQGLQLERFNMRGVFGKQIFEGGAQERALAEENARYADIAAAWPRTSTLLRKTASSWERDAEREDTEAALRRLRS
jgi:hypothetical protein